MTLPARDAWRSWPVGVFPAAVLRALLTPRDVLADVALFEGDASGVLAVLGGRGGARAP